MSCCFHPVKSRKQYTEETTRLIESWIHNSPLQDVAFKKRSWSCRIASPEAGQKLKVQTPFRSLEQKIKFMERRRADRVAHRG